MIDGASRILVVRLGAMGDVIHALPAVATLKRAFPEARIAWAIEDRWSPLLEGNPHVDEVLRIERGSIEALRRNYDRVREGRFPVAVDFQGLLKSAAVVFFSRAKLRFGFQHTRERLARTFYSHAIPVRETHVVDCNLGLAEACGARERLMAFPLPLGAPEGDLPDGPFVLASPIAGWRSKQWPLKYYEALAARMDVPLVLNGAPSAASELHSLRGCLVHLSGLPGLIDATRRAAAVIGVDSGPLHLAAALGKSGVAIFGPTDPSRNGPCGGAIQVLRSPNAVTSYKRSSEISPSMREILPDAVLAALQSERRT